MLQFTLLGSGSSGNALLIKTPRTKILIDSGFSFKELQCRLATHGETAEGLDAVFVTHEHGDHVKGLGVLARKINVPVYVTPLTFNALSPNVGNLPNVRHFESGDLIVVGDLSLTSFTISHDAADPVSYVVESQGCKLGVATDLGAVSQLVRQRLSGAHALVLESNYCPDMLRDGPYPVALKQRIRSAHGHLSNRDMVSLLSELVHVGLRLVVLGHLSEENNNPGLAEQMAARVLLEHHARLHVARQDVPTPLFEVSP